MSSRNVSTDYPAEFLSLFQQIAEPGEPGECWLWPHHTMGNGYGVFETLGIRSLVHRVSHYIYHGPVPAGFDVRHHCDVRRCWNPAHLANGTRKQNLGDAVVRDRTEYGVDRWNHVLTDDDARDIFRRSHNEGVTLARLAAQYGVHPITIHDVVSRRTWRRATEGMAKPDVPIPRQRGPLPTLSAAQVGEIKRRAGGGEHQRVLAREFGVSQPVIWRAVHKP